MTKIWDASLFPHHTCEFIVFTVMRYFHFFLLCAYSLVLLIFQCKLHSSLGYYASHQKPSNERSICNVLTSAVEIVCCCHMLSQLLC